MILTETEGEKNLTAFSKVNKIKGREINFYQKKKKVEKLTWTVLMTPGGLMRSTTRKNVILLQHNVLTTT